MSHHGNEPRDAPGAQPSAVDDGPAESLSGDIIFRALSSSFRAQLETPGGAAEPPPQAG